MCFVLGKCQCGCNSDIEITTNRGFLKRFKHGHNGIGINHYNWKGGRLKRQGYIEIYSPDHPFADIRGYVKEHRLVMEKYLDRYLTSEEHIHHINEIRNDNRIENLRVLTKSEHSILHRKKEIEEGRFSWVKNKK